MKIKRIKLILKKLVNPLLLIGASVLMFAHYFFDNDRNSWYCRDLEKNISIIFLSGFIYRTRQYRDGLLNILYKCAFSFIFLKCSFNIADESLAWFYDIHKHKLILLIQLPILISITGIAIFNLLKELKYDKNRN